MNAQTVVEIFTDGDQNQCLSTSFTTMRIINSIRSCWPVMELHFMMDNQPMIEKDIYGSSDLKVYIWDVGDDGEKVPKPMIWDLMYLESNITLSQKPIQNGPWMNEEETQKGRLIITCLSKPAFIAMSTSVNKLIEGDNTGKTPLCVCKDLLTSKGIEANIKDCGHNTKKIPQLVIPPMTMKSAVDYLNEKFGIFQGPLFRYANYAGQFCMWDLKQHWEKTKATGFTKVHKMPSFAKCPELYNTVVDLVSNRPDHFLTYDNVETLHYGNSAMIKNGYNNIFIAHPHDDIAYYHKMKSDDVIKSQGLWHDNPQMKFHPETKIRKKYYIDWKGFETCSGYGGGFNDYAMSSAIADSFKDATSLKFTLYRKVKISLISRVGEVCYLKPYAEHEMYPGSNYEGAYLISDTEIVLTKESTGAQEDNLECFAKIIGCRTAQSKN